MGTLSSDLSVGQSIRPIRHLRWIIIGLLFLATTVNYIDRQAISVAAPVLSEEFGFTASDYSWIVSSFLFAYALMQILAGRLIDRMGTKRGFSLAVVWWSLANMLHAVGTGVWSFSLFRFLLGLGEAGNYPASLKAISEWFPRSERSMAVGILNVGPGLGAIIAPPLVATLVLTVGWRLAFVATGVIGLLWLVGWQKLYRSPECHPRITPEEAELILRERYQPSSTNDGMRWVDYFRYKEVWGVMLARFVCDGAFYFFVFWLPKYLSDERGFNLAEIGLLAWIPFLAADVGSLSGGWLGGRLIARGWSLNASRKLVIWIGALLVPLVLFAVSARSAFWALMVIAVAMFAIQVKSSSLFTLPADLFASRHVASVWGVSGAAGSFGGMLFQPLVGWFVDHVSYTPVFVIVSVMHILSAAIVMWMIPRVEPLSLR